MNGNPASSLKNDQPFFFTLSPCFVSKLLIYGYTLLEILVVLIVVSILMISLQSPLEQFHKFAITQQMLSDLTMSVQRFHLILKSELVQSGYGIALTENSQQGFEIKDQTLYLRADLNQDGDLNDSREQISYRFDENKQFLLRKSGKGAYQRFLGGITEFKFEYWSSRPCLKITFRLLEQPERQESVLCPIKL